MSKYMIRHLFAFIAAGCLLGGCANRAFVSTDDPMEEIRGRAETQEEESIRVSASVASKQETEALFGVPLYEQGIQPVWIEIENTSDEIIRYAPVSTDRFYFTPHEIAYSNRSGYSEDARADMQQRYDELSLPRYVDPGETRSGFVLTHADNGAKGFNVDLFGPDGSAYFTFLLRVPGFVPDYANIDFKSMYADDELRQVEQDELREELAALPCCSLKQNDGSPGEPVNVTLIVKEGEILQALLRANWIETSREEVSNTKSSVYFGREQDAIFRYQSSSDESYYEMRLWLSPIVTDGQRVWAGQVRHFFEAGASQIKLDPDVDNAREFTLQNFLYNQALLGVAFIKGDAVAPVESFWSRLVGMPFFTDGYGVVLWLSGEPVASTDLAQPGWDTPPRWKK